MSNHTFVVCVVNDGYACSLEVRKLYEVLPDDDAARHGQIRVIDESGEDYLYPESFFAPVQLPALTEERLLQAA
jgi:hypothetical protein